MPPRPICSNSSYSPKRPAAGRPTPGSSKGKPNPSSIKHRGQCPKGAFSGTGVPHVRQGRVSGFVGCTLQTILFTICSYQKRGERYRSKEEQEKALERDVTE